MTTLYNAKTMNNGSYRITKFDENLEVESSYETSELECTCPAGHRQGCRHRFMLPHFIGDRKVNTAWFLDFERQKWVRLDAETRKFTTKEPRPKWRRI